jgi:hypothetical protein
MKPIPATSVAERLGAALAGLLEKYAVDAPPGWTLRLGLDGDVGPAMLLPGWTVREHPLRDGWVPLLPWRSQRRFLELKRLVDDHVVNPVLMARFACQTDGSLLDLPAILYRELDLTEWLLGVPVAAVMASIQGHAANVIVRLGNGVLCGVEAGAMLPAGTSMIDRHELIARRGVACDRVVDTQVPQDSIYAFTSDGAKRYTDTDAELFDLTPDEVLLVRAAFETLQHFDRAEALRRQHRRLAALVRLIFESDRRRERLAVEGETA